MGSEAQIRACRQLPGPSDQATAKQLNQCLLFGAAITLPNDGDGRSAEVATSGAGLRLVKTVSPIFPNIHSAVQIEWAYRVPLI